MRFRTVASFSAVTVALVFMTVAGSGPASAHAIIELDGTSAVAGKTSLMKLEIQHGCLPAEGTIEVEAFVGPSWRTMQPGDVDGWQATVERRSTGGWHITWQNLGTPVPFGKPTFFPITVGWPSKPGTYAMRVTQQCTNGTSYDWSRKYRPATAHSPSPPLTPRPEVSVVAKPEHSGAHPQPSASAQAHAH